MSGIIQSSVTNIGEPTMKDTGLRDKGHNKLYEITCPKCGYVRVTTKNNCDATERRNGKGNFLCKSCALKGNPKLMGRVSPNKGKPSKFRAENASSWKGGTWINNHGYQQSYVGVKKYTATHRLIIAENIGRPLTKDEVVHHINFQKTDNRIENLYLFPDEQAHRQAHASVNAIIATLLKYNLVTFVDGKYCAHVKLGELLENLEKDNQQPSLGGDTFEGSETRSRDLNQVGNASTSAQHGEFISQHDDIVRTTDIIFSFKTVELVDKEPQDRTN